MSDKQNQDNIQEEQKASQPILATDGPTIVPAQIGPSGKTKTQENYLEWSISKATATTTMLVTSITIFGLLAIGYLVLMIYLGIYAYGNPDPKTAFYIDGVDAVSLNKEAISASATKYGVTVRPGYPIDMAVLFRSWFLWGFWGCVVQVCILATAIPLCFVFKSHINMLNMCILVLEAVSCCSSFAWLILGFFWRFSRAGRVTSGEKLSRSSELTDQQWNASVQKASLEDGYQLKSGLFMSAYLWIVVVLFLITIIVGSIFAIINCVQSDAELKDSGASASPPNDTLAESASQEEQIQDRIVTKV